MTMERDMTSEQLLVCFNLKRKSMLLVLAIFLFFQITSGSVELATSCNDGEVRDPQPPDCLDDCIGRRFFLDRDGICKMCVECQPGYQHDKYCGNGENGDAVCIRCPDDHFSYNRYDCVACRVCDNTHITQQCSSSTDRQCGDCLPGFYKDPQNPDFCNQQCEWLSNPDTIPACKEWLASQQATSAPVRISLISSSPGLPVVGEESGHMNATIIIIIVVLIVVIIGGSVIPIYLCYNHCDGAGSKTDTGTFPLQDAENEEQRGTITGSVPSRSASPTEGMQETGDLPSSSSGDQSITSQTGESFGSGTDDVDIEIGRKWLVPNRVVEKVLDDKQMMENVIGRGYKADEREENDCDSPNDINTIASLQLQNYNRNFDYPLGKSNGYVSGGKDVFGSSDDESSAEKFCPPLMSADGNSSTPPPEIPESASLLDSRSMPQPLKSYEGQPTESNSLLSQVSKDGEGIAGGNTSEDSSNPSAMSKPHTLSEYDTRRKIRDAEGSLEGNTSKDGSSPSLMSKPHTLSEFDTRNKKPVTESTPLVAQVSIDREDTIEGNDSKDGSKKTLSGDDSEGEEAEKEQLLTGSTSALPQASTDRPGDDERDGSQGESDDEYQRLLPSAQVEDDDVGEYDGDLRGSGEISQRGLPSRSRKTAVDSKAVQTSLTRPENGQNGNNDRENDIEDHVGGAKGGDDEEWRGSAEAEAFQPKQKKLEKEQPQQELVQLPPAPVNHVHFHGNVGSVIVGGQKNYYGVRPDQG